MAEKPQPVQVLMVEKPRPVQVLYWCSVRFTQLGPDFAKCKPWLIQNAPDLYPDLAKGANSNEEDKVAAQLQSTSIAGTASSGFYETCRERFSEKNGTHFRGSNRNFRISVNEGWKALALASTSCPVKETY